ncbi:MAG: hypothetical protein ACKOOC_08975, partial [Cyanobium sp.]
MVNNRRWVLGVLPELLALLKVAAFGPSLAEAFGWALLFRQAWIGAEVIHGLGHTLARAVLDKEPSAITLGN